MHHAQFCETHARKKIGNESIQWIYIVFCAKGSTDGNKGEKGENKVC